jgi:hypothetical protein
MRTSLKRSRYNRRRRPTSQGRASFLAVVCQGSDPGQRLLLLGEQHMLSVVCRRCANDLASGKPRAHDPTWTLRRSPWNLRKGLRRRSRTDARAGEAVARCGWALNAPYAVTPNHITCIGTRQLALSRELPARSTTSGVGLWPLHVPLSRTRCARGVEQAVCVPVPARGRIISASARLRRLKKTGSCFDL